LVVLLDFGCRRKRGIETVKKPIPALECKGAIKERVLLRTPLFADELNSSQKCMANFKF